MTFEGRTIRENLCGGGAGGGGGWVPKKYLRKGKFNEKNSCTPINPKKYSFCGLNVTQTTAKITLIRSVAVWNPPQCNLGILDLRTNKNLQCLVTRTIPNWTKPKISSEYDPRNAHTACTEPVITHFNFQEPCTGAKVSSIWSLFE